MNDRISYNYKFWNSLKPPPKPRVPTNRRDRYEASKIRTHFRQRWKAIDGNNIRRVTLSDGKRGEYIYELSEVSLVGVKGVTFDLTILNLDGTDSSLSRSEFKTLPEAQDYLKQILPRRRT